MNYKITLLASALLASAMSLSAQDNPPQLILPEPGNKTFVSGMSPNGQWIATSIPATSDEDGVPKVTACTLLNTGDRTKIEVESGFPRTVWTEIRDVLDNGDCLGTDNGRPAVWHFDTKTWTYCELPEDCVSGIIFAGTPDGKIGVGYVSNGEEMHALPAMWDLTTGEYTDLRGLKNFPTRDMTNLDRDQNIIWDISPDGRYLLGQMSSSYMLDLEPPVQGHPYQGAVMVSYVYDMQAKDWDAIGFDVDRENWRWNMKVPGIYFVDGPVMSNNGKWVSGIVYFVANAENPIASDEYRLGFRYNVETKDFELYNGNADKDIAGSAIGNSGRVYGMAPADGNPWPDGQVRVGSFWVSMTQLLEQVYGMTTLREVGLDESGKFQYVNDDETIFILTQYDGAYILKANESLYDAATHVDLLANPTPEYPNRAVLSQLKTFKLTFNRDIEFDPADRTKIILKEDGEQIATCINGTQVTTGNAAALQLAWRTRELKEGSTYEIVIPEGIIRVKGATDNEPLSVTNKKITLRYYGRKMGPVTVNRITPTDGTIVTALASTDPIRITFNDEVMVSPTARGRVFAGESTMSIGDLVFEIDPNNAKAVAAYPAMSLTLYKGENYKVVIDEGSFTDLSGAASSNSAEIVLTYEGGFIDNSSEVDPGVIYSTDATNYEKIMLWDGDKNVPNATSGGPSDWGFDAEIPWLIVRDDDGADPAFAAHCDYVGNNAGDDWMLTRQILVPNDQCILTFDAQSWKNQSRYFDELEVYIYEQDQKVNYISEEFMTDVRANAKLVLKKRLTYGGSMSLANEWTAYSYSLAEYAGKSIYVAFRYAGCAMPTEATEDNPKMLGGSAIFVDNIKVSTKQVFDITVHSAATLVNQAGATINGVVVNRQVEGNLNNLSMELLNDKGEVVSTYKADNLNIAPQDAHVFKFDTQLPLVAGKFNKYTINATWDGEPYAIDGEIANLMFETKKRVTFEEYTGQTCPNCPLGYLAFDYLSGVYGDQFIPIAIRTYQGDQFSVGLTSYTSFLGLDRLGAPSASISRVWATYPAASDPASSTYYLVGKPYGNYLWADAMSDLMQEKAELNVSAKLMYDPNYSANTGYAEIVYNPLFAIDSENRNLAAFAVICENGLVAAFQQNNFAGLDNPFFGEWGKGGKYGQTTVLDLECDHVARYTVGDTYNGTQFPVKNIEAGKQYEEVFGGEVPKQQLSNLDNVYAVVMIIDLDNGYVLNACTAPLEEASGIADVIVDGDNACQISADGAVVTVTAGEAVNVQAFSVAGALLGQGASDNGNVTLSLDGYKGIAIVNATTASGNTVRKLVIR